MIDGIEAPTHRGYWWLQEPGDSGSRVVFVTVHKDGRPRSVQEMTGRESFYDTRYKIEGTRWQPVKPPEMP